MCTVHSRVLVSLDLHVFEANDFPRIGTANE